MAVIGLSWHSGSLNRLGGLTAGQSGTPTGASGTTGIVVGYGPDAGSVTKGMQWSGAAAAALADPGGTVTATTISDDGSVIVGSATGPERWTSGGAVVTALSPGTGYTDASTLGVGWRVVSADGGKVVGTSESGGTFALQATVWTGTTPALLPFHDSNPVNTSTGAGISADGGTYIGTFQGGDRVIGWFSAGSALNYLLPAEDPQTTDMTIRGCLGDGSVVWGQCGADYVYWGGLGTTTVRSGVTYYGVLHALAPPVGGSMSIVHAMADDLVGGQPLLVGQVNAADLTSPAAKWSGTVCTTLALLPGGVLAEAVGVSADGSIIVGKAYDADGNLWPVYWDNTGIHTLPTAADPGDTYPGEALGISADGSWIWGRGDAGTIPPPSPPDPPTGLTCGAAGSSSITAQWEASAGASTYFVEYRAAGDTVWLEAGSTTGTSLEINGLAAGTGYEWQVAAGNTSGISAWSDIHTCSTVGIVAAAPSRNLVWLQWSDDRGHSWSEPVSISFGDTGEYFQSLQWQRLGYARDRLYRLTWSAPVQTNLQGVWLDVSPARS